MLDINNNLKDIKGIKRLGVPGRQGTVIQLNYKGKLYAIKVAPKKTSSGNGETGAMGFLKQARMQQIASQFGITAKVYAIYCGHNLKPSFMVMDSMNKRLVDIYDKNSSMSKKHQLQLWNLYKYMDEEIGIIHNDINPLNIMTDFDNNIKLIDFDRSQIIENKHLKKWGNYPNLRFSYLVYRKIKSNTDILDQLYIEFKKNQYK